MGAPEKICQNNALQNGGKRPFAEYIVAESIIDLHAKMEKLAPLHPCFIRTIMKFRLAVFNFFLNF